MTLDQFIQLLKDQRNGKNPSVNRRLHSGLAYIERGFCPENDFDPSGSIKFFEKVKESEYP